MKLAGRPFKFKAVKDLEAGIDEFLATVVDEDRNVIQPITQSGLAAFLGITPETLSKYKKRGKKWAELLGKFKSLCEAYAEDYLFTGRNVTGAIFNLKVNHGWKEDRAGIDLGGGLRITVVEEDPFTAPGEDDDRG